MTVLETKQRIEKELAAVKESFGEASSLVKYSVEVEVNHIEGAEEDITYVFGSLSIGPEGSGDEDRLYLPLDAELDDNDIVDEEQFERSLAQFKEKTASIRERILSSKDYNEEAKLVIEDFDREMDEMYRAEMERLNRVAKKNLIIAGVAAAIAIAVAIIVLVAEKLA
jgi:hypothetical protein